MALLLPVLLTPATARGASIVPLGTTAHLYVDQPDGYELTPPGSGWTFDNRLLPDVSRWNSAYATLRVYLQPVHGAQGVQNYVGYSNRSIDRQWNGIQRLVYWHFDNPALLPSAGGTAVSGGQNAPGTVTPASPAAGSSSTSGRSAAGTGTGGSGTSDSGAPGSGRTAGASSGGGSAGSNAPSGGGSTPSAGSAASGNATVAGGGTPGAPTGTSGAPTGTSGAPTGTSGAPTGTPGAPTATPGAPTATPGAPTATPASGAGSSTATGGAATGPTSTASGSPGVERGGGTSPGAAAPRATSPAGPATAGGTSPGSAPPHATSPAGPAAAGQVSPAASPQSTSAMVGQVWYRRWQRPAMPLLHPDEREYAEWDEVLAPGRVLTVMLSATPAAFQAAYDVAARAFFSARPIPIGGANIYHMPPTPQPAKPPLLVPRRSGLVWGIYEPSLDVNAPNFGPVNQLAAELHNRLKLVMVYRQIGFPFPTRLIREAAAQGRIIELTLQSWSPSSNAARALPYGHATSAIGALLQGRYDAYLRRFAKAAAAVRLPFFFRWDNEMNGDWDPWSAFQWGKDPSLYIAAWRHVYNIFQQEGATNAVWIWNPNNQSLPHYRWNAAALYYPGSRYVQWVGLTAYNVGNGQPGGQWRSFDQLFRPAYGLDRALYPDKPLLITEFASHDAPGNKAAWIRAMFASLRSYPAIRYAVWWNGQQGALHYKLDQPPSAMQAFKAGLSGVP